MTVQFGICTRLLTEARLLDRDHRRTKHGWPSRYAIRELHPYDLADGGRP